MLRNSSPFSVLVPMVEESVIVSEVAEHVYSTHPTKGPCMYEYLSHTIIPSRSRFKPIFLNTHNYMNWEIK